MADREHIAQELLRYIRSGMTDETLKEKHLQSYKNLHDLITELAEAGFIGPDVQELLTPSKRKISVRKMVRDIRRGADKAELMAKYELSQRELRSALKQLVATEAVSRAQLCSDLGLLCEAVDAAALRREPRYCLDFELPVWETINPEVRGQVLDITEKGLGVIGLPAALGEVKHLEVFSEDFFEIEPFSLAAQCRWAKKDDDLNEYVSGFQILAMSDDDRQQLRQLIDLLRC